MSEEKDFFKTCFNTVAGLEVKNESQAIAKEVVLSEIETLEQQCKKQKEVIDKTIEYIKEHTELAPFNEDGEGGGLLLCDYDVANVLELLMTCSKAQAINKYIDELEENMILTNQWYKSQQENKQLKELIDTILNWDIFKNECPMNFGYDEETNEDKAQDVFYKDDDYCENNCNDDYTKCWLKYFKELQKTKGDVKNEN